MSKVIIIGGGASGLSCAIHASKNNEVIVLEQNEICGKKLLATGNGRCNYFNEDFTIEHYHSNNKSSLENIITKTQKEEALYFFESIGISPKIKNGYYYPNSNQASSIVDTLMIEAKRRGVQIITNTQVNKITKNGNRFEIITNNIIYTCDKVVLACGTPAGVNYNYNMDNMLANFNHKKYNFLPALVQLKTEGDFLKKWAGIRVDANIKLYDNKNFVKSEVGELQLVDYGISGICIFNLSIIAAKSLEDNHDVSVEIDFLPNLDVKNLDVFINWIDDRNNNLKNRTIEELFIGLINRKLLKILIDNSKLKSDFWQELSLEEKKNFAKNIKQFTLKVIGTNPISRAQVCSGGIDLNEIDMDTFESKLVKGLYFIGEVLDVVGDCGGYNLAFAWISGKRCGKSL